MPTSYLCAIHFKPMIDTYLASKRLSSSLNIFKKHGLEPMPFAKEEWENGSDKIFGGTTLLHPFFASKTKDPFWGVGFMVLNADKIDNTIITMMVSGHDVEVKGDTWNWLIDLAEDICDNMEADLGLINGFTIRGKNSEYGGTPAGEEVATYMPTVLCPWMYIGSKRLIEYNLISGLISLNDIAARSSPTKKGGWIIKCHEQYSNKSPTQLLKTYAHLWNFEKVYWEGV